MGYSNILVAVDLSEQSREVLDTAKTIANRNSARLSLTTVIKPLAQAYGGMNMAPLGSGMLSFEADAISQARIQLAALGGEYGIDEDHQHLLQGAPADEIRDLAQAIGADLIVIGSHGRHGLSLLLGSTANGVLHGAGCNVLAVRLQYD